MKRNGGILSSVFLRPQAILILLVTTLLTGAATFLYCRSLHPRYAVTALVDAAELSLNKVDTDPREALFRNSSSSDIKQDTLAYLDFTYTIGGRSVNGAVVAEAKDQKATNLIQLVIEGYSHDSVKLFLMDVVHDLQSRYAAKIAGILEQEKNQIERARSEILSLETFRIQVETAIHKVGPSPVLGSQLMEINHDLSRLKQELMVREAAISAEKIHNFRLISIHSVAGGKAIWPKTNQMISFGMMIALVLTSYVLFLREVFRRKKGDRTDERTGSSSVMADVVTDPSPERHGRFAVENISQANWESPSSTERVVAKPPAGLQEGLSAQSIFLSNINNEIRNPLNTVLGMTGMLLGTRLDRNQKEYANAIRSSADSLLVLLNDLLNLASNKQGPTFLENTQFNMSSLMENVCENLPYSVQSETKQVLYYISEEARNCLFFGDRLRIGQILTNLIVNAIKFADNRRATVNVSVENGVADAAVLCIEVIDSGAGIPEQALARMFEAFQQRDMSPSRRFGGSGLGLAIAKKLVHEMDGQIGVFSELGKGSKFWFKVPLKRLPQSANAKIENESYERLTSARKLRVLIAEDNVFHQKVLINMLEKLGHHGDAVANGNEALDALRSLHYDLILMDCQMPELDGYEATRMIRASKTLPQKDILIIAVTALESAESREECRRAGMTDFLVKPVSLKDLNLAIERSSDPLKKSA